MRNIPQDLYNYISNSIATTGFLLEFYFTFGEYYFTDIEDDIYYDNKHYRSYPFKVENINYSIDNQADEIRVVFDNVSLLPVSMFLNEDQRGRDTILRFFAIDENYNVLGSFEVFSGFINNIRIKEEENTSICEIGITHELALWKKNTLRYVTYRCPWRFGDVNCKYKPKPNETCDKTYSTCMKYKNTANFGGFPNLEDIEHKEIIWGRQNIVNLKDHEHK